MTAILVMCTGNICRSPMAEGLLRDALLARFADRAPAVSSAGTAGLEGSGARPESIRAAAELGSDIARHRARVVAPSMPREADLVVCMAMEHVDDLVRSDPGLRAKTFSLKELTRLLEGLGEAGGDARPDDLRARIAQADELRRSGFTGNPHDDDVADPLGMPLDAYRAIAWELDRWIARLVDGLYGTVDLPAASEGA